MVQPGADLRLVGVADLSGVVALALFNAAVTFGILRARLELDRVWLRTRELFRDVWPLGLSDFTWACLWYSPVLLSAWIGTSADAAFIGGPIRVVLALHTFIWLYFVNLLPGLAKGLAEGAGTWQALTDASMRVSMWVGGLVGLFGTLAGGWIVTLLYGPGFVPAIAPFQVVIWVIPVVWFSGNFRFTLIAGGHQRWELRALIVGALITTVGTLALAPTLGALGAAVAFLVGSIGNAWFAVRATIAQVGPVRLLRGMLPCAAAVLVCLTIGLALTHVIGMLPATAVAMAAYLAVAVWQNAANVHVVLGRLNQ
jgi:O-antigen/teichoic acid export membrane protein